MANLFENSSANIEDLIKKSKKIAQGESLAARGIAAAWLTTYTKIARRYRDDREVGLTHYLHETGPIVSAFQGGFTGHKKWPIRLNLKTKGSMKPFPTNEAKDTNSSGYCFSFAEAAMQLRHDAIVSKEDDEAAKYDVWCIMAMRYALSVVWIRSKFYRMGTDDPVTAKMLIPGLGRRLDMPAGDDMVEIMEKIDTHYNTQLLKADTALKAHNAGKKTVQGRGGATDGN